MRIPVVLTLVTRLFPSSHRHERGADAVGTPPPRRCDFEVAVIEVPGTAPQRKALEATAITLHRMDAGRSPTASFGRMPARYTMSTGNNARLVAAGRRHRGGPDPAAPPGAASAPVAGLPSADPASPDWMTWTWSPWAPISEARRSATGAGLYRIRSNYYHAELVYVGQGSIAPRLRTHAAKALRAGRRQGPCFSGDLEASWVALPGIALVNLLEHENDLIAAHVLTTGHAPAAQFLG